jgi:hypothetical protein
MAVERKARSLWACHYKLVAVQVLLSEAWESEQLEGLEAQRFAGMWEWRNAVEETP